MFPGHFQGVVFVSVAVVDSDVFKGAEQVEALRGADGGEPRRATSASRGPSAWPRRARTRSGPRSRVEAESLGVELFARYPKASSSPASSSSRRTRSGTALLHNETAFLIQRRLQHAGVPMIVLPVRITLARGGPRAARPRRGVSRARDLAERRIGRRVGRAAIAGPSGSPLSPPLASGGAPSLLSGAPTSAPVSGVDPWSGGASCGATSCGESAAASG